MYCEIRSRSSGITSYAGLLPLKPACIFLITSTMEYDLVTILCLALIWSVSFSILCSVSGAKMSPSTRICICVDPPKASLIFVLATRNLESGGK